MIHLFYPNHLPWSNPPQKPLPRIWPLPLPSRTKWFLLIFFLSLSLSNIFPISKIISMFYIIFYSFILFAIVIFFFNFVFSKITDTITKISNKSFFSYIRFIYNRICVCTEKRVLYPYIKFWDNLYLILCGILFQFQAAIFPLVFMLPECSKEAPRKGKQNITRQT